MSRAPTVGASERDTPRGYNNTRLEWSRVERQVAWHRLFFPAPTNSARFPTPIKRHTVRHRPASILPGDRDAARTETRPGPSWPLPAFGENGLAVDAWGRPAQPSPTSSLRARGQLQPHAVPPEENQDTRLFTEIPFALRTLGYVRDGQTGPSPRHSFGTARVMVANPAIKLVKAKGLALSLPDRRTRPTHRASSSQQAVGVFIPLAASRCDRPDHDLVQPPQMAPSSRSKRALISRSVSEASRQRTTVPNGIADHNVQWLHLLRKTGTSPNMVFFRDPPQDRWPRDVSLDF